MTKKAAVVALGMFDGIHVGHRRLLETAVQMAEKNGACAVACTFSNSPQALFRTAPDIITLPEEKRAIIESLGLEVDMQPFTKEFATQSPDEYVRSLVDKYELKGVVAGFNYRFGVKRMGDSAFLRGAGNMYGFEVCILEPVVYRGFPVSSTRVRTAIKDGDMTLANAMLKEPFFYRGVVSPRNHIGHKLGYPTANIMPGGKILPPLGVYATVAEVDGKGYAAVTNIGVRPTVENAKEPAVIIEPHLIDYEGLELYGKEIKLSIVAYIRPERKFADFEQLSKQIGKDLEKTRRILSETKNRQAQSM